MKSALQAIVLTMKFGVVAGNASAADQKLNPFKLAYEGGVRSLYLPIPLRSSLALPFQRLRDGLLAPGKWHRYRQRHLLPEGAASTLRYLHVQALPCNEQLPSRQPAGSP